MTRITNAAYQGGYPGKLGPTGKLAGTLKIDNGGFRMWSFIRPLNIPWEEITDIEIIDAGTARIPGAVLAAGVFGLLKYQMSGIILHCRRGDVIIQINKCNALALRAKLHPWMSRLPVAA